MKKDFTLRQLSGAGHIAIFYRPDHRGFLDDLLASHGLRWRLLVASPHFLALPFAVSESDLIALFLRTGSALS